MKDADFLPLLFEYAPEDLWLYLWKLDGRRTFPFAVPQAQDAAHFATGKPNIYIGTSLAPNRLSEFQRVENDNSAGIVALWADVDFASPAHSKPGLPPDLQCAQQVIDAMPLKPTVVIHSGHGLQPWWFLKEAFLFQNAEQRQQGAALCYGWERLLHSHAQQHKWVLDSTSDLARILRVPGSLNAKKDQPVVPVTICYADATLRYDPSDFGAFLEKMPQTASGTPLVIYGVTMPSAAELMAFLDSNARAKKAFRRTLVCPDQSPSGQDWHLALALAQSGWAEDRIAGALVSCREFNGEDMKHERYYTATAAKVCQVVREERDRLAVTSKLDEYVATLNSPAPTQAEDGAGDENAAATAESVAKQNQDRIKQELLESISKLYNVRFVRIVKYVSVVEGEHIEPEFKIFLENGSIMLGTMSHWDQQNLFDRKLSVITNQLPTPMKGAPWRAFVRSIIQLAESEEIGEDANDIGNILSMIRDYVYKTLHSCADESIPLDEGLPFERDGRVAITAEHFIRWGAINRNLKSAPRQIAALFRRAGLVRDTANFKRAGKKTSRSIWWLPEPKS